MQELVSTAEVFLYLIFITFVSTFLIYLISHLLMATIKTIFFDVQLKKYLNWKKNLKK